MNTINILSFERPARCKYYFALACLICFSIAPLNLISQGNDVPAIGIMGIFYNDSVYLRWAPTSIESFNSAIEDGFSLKRGLFAVNGTVEPQDSFEASITTLDTEIELIAEQDWVNVNVTPEIRDAAIEIFYNFQYTAPHIDSVNIFSALDEEEKKKTFVTIASIVADRDWDGAQAIGWAFKDGSVDTGNQYVYILTLKDTGEKFYTLVHTDSEYELVNLPKPSAYPGDKIAKLSFKKPPSSDYYGYYIEMSSDSGLTFELITPTPILYDDERNPGLFNYIDSLSSNDVTYIYRISGVNAFGLQSAWSDTVTVKGIPSPLSASPDIHKIEADGAGVDIHFSFPSELESEIQGFEVIRSLHRDGPFLNISGLLNGNIREFHDEEPLHSNFYFIRAIDNNGYPLLSIPHFYAPADSLAPEIPIGLTGSIDNNNTAHLLWNANEEHDIKGYRLYAANGLEGLFVEITPGTIKDSIYLYQLGNNVLNTDWFVKIRSVDYNENESELSEPVLINRPDLFPPTAPVLKDLNSFAFGIGMNWIKSSSPDVVSHVLQRKQMGGNWNTILDITNTQIQPTSTKGWQEGSQDGKEQIFMFIDSTTQAREVYLYRVLAADASGNIASSSILEATGYDHGLRGEIFDLMAVDMPYTVYTTTNYAADKEKAGIAVGWDYTDTLGVHHFIIYRSADKWPFQSYQSYLVYEGRSNPAATTDGSELSAGSSGLTSRYIFIDKEVLPGKVYKYKIVAKHLDGGFSKTSEVVSVTATTQN